MCVKNHEKSKITQNSRIEEITSFFFFFFAIQVKSGTAQLHLLYFGLFPRVKVPHLLRKYRCQKGSLAATSRNYPVCISSLRGVVI